MKIADDVSSRRAGYGVALPHAVYTSGQMLELYPETATLCHFLDRPARLRGGTARSARRCSIVTPDITRVRPGHHRTEWRGCTESATSISAHCSLSQHSVRSAECWVRGAECGVPCPCVDLAVARHSWVLNHALFEAIVPLRLRRIQERWCLRRLCLCGAAVTRRAAVLDNRALACDVEIVLEKC